jgi:hypothetical protein
MKINEISPIFLANLQHKVFCYPDNTKVEVVKLKCINPTKQLIKGDTYWGYKKEGHATSSWTWDQLYFDVYKIFLPILGCRQYDPKRFIVLDKLTVYKKDFE